MARRKRASMREGPLADLFRSTADDAPADPPELDAPTAGPDKDAGGALRSGTSSTPSTSSDEASSGQAPDQPRYGRENPADRVHAEDAHSAPSADAPAADQAADVEPEHPPVSAETPPERLKRVFSEEPRQRREIEPIVETPRYGREEPAYEPPGSGEPHQPVIRVVGVGGAGVNAVNRMVEARVPGVEFMAVNTDLQSLQLCVADVTVHIGDEQTRGLGAGADPEVGHRSAFEE